MSGFGRRVLNALAGDWSDDAPATRAAVQRTLTVSVVVAALAWATAFVGVILADHALLAVSCVLVLVAVLWWAAALRIFIRYRKRNDG